MLSRAKCLRCNCNALTKTIRLAPTKKGGVRNFFTFVNQYENAVTFTFGRLSSVKKSGIRIFIPAIQEMYKVDLRTRITELTPQKIITRDNVSCEVNAVIYFHVTDAKEAVMQVDNVDDAIHQLAQTELRDLLCQQSFNQILENREEASLIIAKRLKEKANKWGVKIEHIQLKNIDLIEEDMIRAMAKEAEATRERKAAMIRASGEEESAYKLREAAKLLTATPIGLELRQLQMLETISKEENQTTYILPDAVLEDNDALIGTAMAGAVSNKNDANTQVFDNENDDSSRLQMNNNDENNTLNMTLGEMLQRMMNDPSQFNDGNEPAFRS